MGCKTSPILGYCEVHNSTEGGKGVLRYGGSVVVVFLSLEKV